MVGLMFICLSARTQRTLRGNSEILICDASLYRAWFSCHHSTNYKYCNIVFATWFHSQTWHSIYKSGPHSMKQCFRWPNPTVQSPFEKNPKGEMCETSVPGKRFIYCERCFVVFPFEIIVTFPSETAIAGSDWWTNLQTIYPLAHWGKHYLNYNTVSLVLSAFRVLPVSVHCIHPCCSLPIEQLTDLLRLCNLRCLWALNLW